MTANTAQFLISIADMAPDNFEVVRFCGVDAISVPYYFDIDFRLSKTARKSGVSLSVDGVVGQPCRLSILCCGDGGVSYGGIVCEFRTYDADDAGYSIRLMPSMQRLSLNRTGRVFKDKTVIEIVKSVVGTGLADRFRFEVAADEVKYPKRGYCVQYQETDLDFISRLLEESGVWYYFEQTEDGGERAVVTDRFCEFAVIEGEIPFMRGSGFAEIAGTGTGAGAGGKLMVAAAQSSGSFAAAAGSAVAASARDPGDRVVESISYLSATRKLTPLSVRVRSYNYRTPEAAPEAMCNAGGGGGCEYEYGGSFKNISEAEHRALLRADRLRLENMRMDGKGNCAAFKAGARVTIRHDGDKAMDGEFLLVSVKHTGGWHGGAYTYVNEFSCVSADPQIYVPPLRTPAPHVGGLFTAPVAATGGSIPTLEEKYGCYHIGLPFVENIEDGAGFGKSKPIRVAQPSAGACAQDAGSASYGIHFPVKQDAEMVLAYVNGDPDKPLGLGFVPNANAPSVVRCENNLENVIRTWGGNELVMDDTDGEESVRLSTKAKRYLELSDGGNTIRIVNGENSVIINGGDNSITVSAKGNVNIAAGGKIMLDGKEGISVGGRMIDVN